MKGYVRHLISGLVLILTPLNSLGDEPSISKVFGDAREKSSSASILGNGSVDPPDDPASETILAEVIAWTVAQTDYGSPRTLPEISFQPKAFFADRGCSSQADCSAMGAYRDGEDRIFLHEDYRDLAGIIARAMLVHELTHLLQGQSGQWTRDDCRSWVAREREAYLLQRRYLIFKGGFRPHAFSLPSVSEAACE